MTIQDALRGLTYRCGLLMIFGLLSACGGGGGGSTTTSVDTTSDNGTTNTTQTTWTTRHTGIAGAFYDVLWDGSRYLAVSDGSGLYSSTDGFNWSRVATSGFGGNFSLAYINGLYLSGGDWQTLYTSTDGVNWDSHSLCEVTLGCFNGVYGLAGNAKGFVAVGEEGLLYYSGDGVDWSVQDGLIGTWENFRAAAASPDRFVVVGASNGVIYSDDGMTWTAASFGTATPPTFGEVIWTGSQFVAAGWGSVYTSADGITWTYMSAQYIDGFIWTGTQYESFDYSSSDLLNWSQLPRSSYFYDLDRGLLDLNYRPETGQYVISGGGLVGGQGWMAVSNDGNAWSMVMSSHDMVGATWAGDHFVAIDSSGVLFDSPDGINWASDKIIKTQDDWSSEVYSAIAWSPLYSRYVAVSSARIAVSDDGVNWSNATAPRTGQKVKWLNNQFVVTGFSGTFLTSSDGLVWNSSPVSGSVTTYPNIRDFSWSDTLGLYAAVDLSGSIYTSPDTLNWTEYNAIAPAGLRTIIWAGGQFVAAGDQGTFMTSTDGVTWVDRSGSLSTIYDLTYAAGRYYAISISGRVYVSTDGHTWSEETTDSAKTLIALATDGSRVIALGEDGTITSRP